MARAKRLEPDERKTLILDTGAKLAGKFGAVNVTRKMVAKEAKVSPGLIAYYLGSSADAQKAYAKRAKRLGIKQPDKATIAELGVKLRAHGPRKNPVKRRPTTRVRSEREKAAIKRKVRKQPAAVVNTIDNPQPVNVPPPRRRKRLAPLPVPPNQE